MNLFLSCKSWHVYLNQKAYIFYVLELDFELIRACLCVCVLNTPKSCIDMKFNELDLVPLGGLFFYLKTSKQIEEIF